MDKSWNCVFEFLWEPCYLTLYMGLLVPPFLSTTIPGRRRLSHLCRSSLGTKIVIKLPMSSSATLLPLFLEWLLFSFALLVNSLEVITCQSSLGTKIVIKLPMSSSSTLRPLFSEWLLFSFALFSKLSSSISNVRMPVQQQV